MLRLNEENRMEEKMGVRLLCGFEKAFDSIKTEHRDHMEEEKHW